MNYASKLLDSRAKISSQCKNIIANAISHYRKRKKERTVDALALGGEEGRGKLR